MKPGKLDRTAFKHQTLAEAAHNLKYWQGHSYAERLKAANYLNSIAYNFDANNPPRMHKTYFIIKKRK